MSRDPVQCPICGWTGQPSDLDGVEDDGAGGSCPVCDESIEFVE